MGLLDFLSKVQELANTPAEVIEKKTEEFSNKLASLQFQPVENKPKERKAVKNKSDRKENKKPPAPKRGLSIEQITEQTLVQRNNIRRNGFAEYIFIASKGCCESCAALNDKHFPISKLKPGENAPPMHEGCRCSIAAYSDRAEYEAWLDFLAAGGTTKEWEKLKKHN